MPTTADNYDSGGWYPGKKYTMGDRLKTIGSFGIWQPDNRHATDYNRQIAQTRNQQELMAREAELRRTTAKGMREDTDAADLTRKRSDHDVGLELVQDYLRQAYPDKTPEEIARVAATHFAAPMTADIAGNKAREAGSNNDLATANAKSAHIQELVDAEAAMKLENARKEQQVAENDRKRALGAAPTQLTLGDQQAMADLRRAQLTGETARNNLSYQQEFGNQGGPGQALEADLADIRARTATSNLGADTANFTGNINRATNPSRWNVALSDAQTALNNSQIAQELSGAKRDLVGKNATALSTADLNKQGAMVLPYGGQVHIPLSVGGTNVLQGEVRNPGFETSNSTSIGPNGEILKKTIKTPLGWAPGGTNNPALKVLSEEELLKFLPKQ